MADRISEKSSIDNETPAPEDSIDIIPAHCIAICDVGAADDNG